jgi:hypothetical protein
MHRLPLKWFALMFAAGCLSSCGKQQPSGTSSANVIEPGVGIRDRVEVGMTTRQVKKRNSDLLLKTKWAGMPEWWEKLWAERWGFSGKIPSLETGFSASARARVHSIYFGPERTSLISLRAGSNLIPFGAGQKLSRQKVIEVFGKPTEFLVSPGSGALLPGIATNLPALLRKGRSVSWSSMGDETLYFPTNGIIFNLTADVVNRIVIVDKVIPSSTDSSGR